MEDLVLPVATARPSIDEFFPHEKFRQDQAEAIQKILDNFDKGKKFVIAEMPTGAGKSAIAYTVAHYYQTSFYVTIQKFLQDQIMKDFGQPKKQGLIPVVDLKGRGNYTCTHDSRQAPILIKMLLKSLNYPDQVAQEAADYFSKKGSLDGSPVKVRNEDVSKVIEMFGRETACDKGTCRIRDSTSRCKECFPSNQLESPYCPYWRRHGEAHRSRICLMNFRSFLYQTALTRAFGKRELMVIDEAHNTESELLSFIGFSLNDKSFREYGVIFPKLSSAKDYAKFLEDKRILDVIENIIGIAKAAGDLSKEDEWQDIKRRCENFLTTAGDGNWVCLYKENTKTKGIWSTIELKPVYVKDMANMFLFNMADKILMMSATILSPNVICTSLGIDKKDVFSVRFGSRFPIKNRPIYFDPVGSLSFKNKEKSMPDVIKKVDEILDKYKGMRGIVHTHNFEISRILTTKCRNRGRMLFQEHWETKTEMLQEHAESTDTVIVAPAMHEGLDLKDDLSRFQIIVKVPYPSLKDNPQLEARMQDSQEYYDWLTALKIVQSSGRSVRHEADWAHTYIIDSDFGWFQKKAANMLPKWFTEALE
jgi:Rad3-related DNA helicase